MFSSYTPTTADDLYIVKILFEILIVFLIIYMRHKKIVVFFIIVDKKIICSVKKLENVIRRSS